MKKKLLFSLLISAVAILAPSAIFADDLQLTSGQTIRVTLTGPTTTYTLTSTTGIESISVNGSTMTLTLASGDNVTVTSSNGYIINNNISAQTACGTSSSSITFTQTATVTSSNASAGCTFSGGSGTGGVTPSDTSIQINSGAGETSTRSVTLNLSAKNATQMKISNLATLSDASFVPYSQTKSWTLTEGDGQKRVYVIYSSSTGGESSSISAVITLATPAQPSSAPSVPSGGGGGGGGGGAPSAPSTTPSTPSTQPSSGAPALSQGDIVKMPGSPAVYIVENGKLRPYLNERIFLAYGKSFDAVKEVSNLSGYAEGTAVDLFPDSYDFTCGQLVKASNAKVYIVSKCEDGMKKEIAWIETEAVFLGGGWSFAHVNYISDAKRVEFSEAASFTALNTHPAGTLIKYGTSSKVYLLREIDGMVKKSWIATEAEFVRKNFQWSDILTLPSRETYPEGPNLGGTVLGESYSEVFISYLSRGSVGDEVRALQEKLKALGFFPETSQASGYFGPLTENAVLEFQKANGLNPLGVVGPATRKLLNSL